MAGTSAREFIPPPEAPIFEPTDEEFKNPLEYIAKIRPIAEKTGICKIKPPSHWQPPFAVDVDNFKFTPRVQKLNELEAKTRTKLNFLDNLAKFWELQGCHIRIPNVERKHLDLFELRKAVHDNGGYDIVCKERAWAKVAHQMDYPTGKGVGSTLRTHYEKILYPYDVFKSGATFDPADLESHSPQKAKQRKGKEIKQEIKEEKTSPPQKVEKDAPKKVADSSVTVTVKEEIVDKESAPMSPTRSEDGGPGSRRSRRILKEEPDEESENIDGKEPDLDYTANPELKKLQFYGAGPKMAIPAGSTKDEPEEEQQPASTTGSKVKGRKLTMRTRKRNKNVTYKVDHYMCHTCGRGDSEESMLLCDGCDDAFHLFCLIPPMIEVPKGDWRCPKCVAKECKRALDPYGFEQAKKEYTLQSFGEMADQFKADYFNMPVHMVPCELAEKEFWRLVDCVDEDVIIEYGADIHAADSGSGFPTKSTADQFPEDEEYINSTWNLNNLPSAPASVLHHITADISGMKVPWCYVGMCFSSFCWHIEDHWSYSINYNHWGEPKTWYGVPGSKAELLEECMKKNAPELFEQAPDLLHQLTTIINPNILMAYGVPIVRIDQHAGEFVITFPRAYHAGFNQGYNFCEAVNFCPADWLPIGRACIDHYRSMRRQCVFSHEELICKMAADPDSLDLVLAAATHGDMLAMVEREKKLRKQLLDRGITEAEREAFELLPDDERQCDFCKTTCFLSAVTCPCSPDKLVCIEHVEDLCECPTSQQCLRYRYTLDELPAMLHRLKVRAEAFDNWAFKVRGALDSTAEDKLELQDLKNMIKEAEDKKFPSSALLQTLTSAVNEAEKCANVANQLVTKKVRTRHRQSGDSKYVAKLSLSELQSFSEQVNNLPCCIKEAQLITDLLQKVSDFQVEAQNALDEEAPDSLKLEKLVEFAVNLDVDLPEIPKLKQVLQQARWLDNVRNTMSEPGEVTLETMRKLIESGVTLAPHPACEKAMAELQELLTLSERWEEKARLCIQSRPRHTMATLESIINESKNIPAYLPNVSALKEALRKAKEWTTKVESIQAAEQYPYLEMLEGMVNKGRPISVRLDPLPQLESQVAAAKSWRERTARTFLKKNCTYSLVEVLSPRNDIGIYGGARKKKKSIKESTEKDNNNAAEETTERRNPAAIVAMFKQAEEKEVELMRELRTRNMEKNNQEGEDARYCTCRRGRSGHMLQCELCKDLFHSSCVPLPKSAQIKSKNSQAMLVQAARDMKFLCPHCLRSRRPRLETILSLLVSLQKLPVRLPEGEALQCLTERAMAWQDRARQSLATDELASALARLSSLSQKIVEQANREKTEKIISAEILKVTTNPELSAPATTLLSPAATLLSSALESMAANVDVDHSLNDAAQLSSEEAGSTDEMGEPELFSVDFTGMSSEHAYSSASKGGLPTTAAAVPSLMPKKHGRKSPLVPRKDSPVLELSDLAKAQLEELMMEGDLLEVSLDETQHIWRILQACQPRQEDVLPGEVENGDEEDLARPKLNIPPKMDGIEKKKKKKRPKVEGQLEPGVEGQVKPKKKKLKLLNKELKDKVKMKDGQKFPEGMEKKKKLKIKTKKKDGIEGFEKKKKQKKEKLPQQMLMDDDNDDDCAAIKCLKPTGEEVNWVQCDRCEQWFHMLCIGLAEEDISENEDYICYNCNPSGRPRVTNGLAPLVMRRNSVDSEGSTDVVVTDNGINYSQDLPTEMVNTSQVSDKTELPVVESQLKAAEIPVVEKATEVMDTSESDPVDIMDFDETEGKGIAQSEVLSTEKSAPGVAQDLEVLESNAAEMEDQITSVTDKEIELSTEIETETSITMKDSEHAETSDVVVEQTASEPVESFTSLSDQVDV